MSVQHLTAFDAAASQYFLSRAVAARFASGYGTFEYDIDGALQASQYGLAYVAARNALRVASMAWLAAEGKLTSLIELARVFDTWAASGHAPELWREAWGLECMNPITEREVEAYVQACRRFARERLRIDEIASYGAYYSSTAVREHDQRTIQLSAILDHLGIQQVLPDSAVRREQREFARASLDRS